jgi:single-stranded-DNA-specific exonuclease
LEKSILEDIQAYLKGHPDVLRQRTLVLSQSGWHAGVLGIVASRIMDIYFRPVVLIASPPEAEGGIGKGSARSVPGINLYDALAACTQHLENFGGHSLAAGLQIRNENIYEFQKAFEAVVQRVAEPEDLIPTLYIDYVLNFEEISEKLIDELESLMPFGTGNPEPLFMSKNVTVVSSRIVGNNHRQMVLSQPSRSDYSKINAIHFNVDDRNSQKKVFDQIVFRLRWNRWNGRKIAQIMVEDT